MTCTRLPPFPRLARLRRLAAALGAGSLVGLGCCHAGYGGLFPDGVLAAPGPAPACAPAAAGPAPSPPHAAPLPAVPPSVSGTPPDAPALASGHEPGWLPRATSP